jgi:anti-sigma regulatory factor (Ser/Thr protein kinase)
MIMRASVRKKNIVITLVDDGIPAPALDFTTMPGDLAEGGRGLALARAVLGHLAYRRHRDLNFWTLVSDSFPTALTPVCQASRIR